MRKFFYCNLETNVVTDNRTFWKTVKPLLSEKVTKNYKINLVEGDKIISRDVQIAKKFSEYSINIPILNMQSNCYKCPDSSEQDVILRILHKRKNHPGIKLIKAKNNSPVLSSVKLTSKKSKNLSRVLTRKNPDKTMILKQIY